MSPAQPLPPRLHLTNTTDYRDSYANSVQMRVNLWDFFLLFGTVAHQTGPDSVTIQNFQGIYLSPPQAKALANLLQQNLKQYEAAFGEIHLESQSGSGVVQ
jgi:flagellar protein FlaG